MASEPQQANLIAYTIQISSDDFEVLQYNSNKDYVAGYLMGKAKPVWAIKREKDAK